MPNRTRDIGREIDSQEPSLELKRAVARDLEENAGKRAIPDDNPDRGPDSSPDASDAKDERSGG